MRLLVFQNQGDETRFVDNAAVDAAAYPEIVAWTRLFASPCWRQQAMADNLNPEPIANAVLTALFMEFALENVKFPPVTQWIMDQTAAVRDPEGVLFLRRQPAPEHYQSTVRVPRQRHDVSPGSIDKTKETIQVWTDPFFS